jgi:hypothetical protein
MSLDDRILSQCVISDVDSVEMTPEGFLRMGRPQRVTDGGILSSLISEMVSNGSEMNWNPSGLT